MFIQYKGTDLFTHWAWNFLRFQVHILEYFLRTLKRDDENRHICVPFSVSGVSSKLLLSASSNFMFGYICSLAIKNVILKNFKILHYDPETKHIFSLPPLISFKCDKNLGNFLDRSAFKFNNQSGTFTCKRTRCKTCPFISNTVKISGPNRSVKVTDHFTCIPTNVIYCITCTLCKKIYIGETGRRLADRFREHLYETQNKTTQMRPNQSLAISIFLTTPTTT